MGHSILLRCAAVLSIVLAGCTPPVSGADAADGSIDADANVPLDVTPPDSVPPDVTPPWLVPWSPTPRAHFPAQFLWGSATSAFQVEGQLHNIDWYQWEQTGHVANHDHMDDGPQSLTQYPQDIQALVEMSNNAYRLGIEWARLFPDAAAWASCRDATGDAAAVQLACHNAASTTGLAYYHTVLDALTARNITALVTLWHFSLPTYIDDLTQDWHSQGFMRDGIVDDFARFAGFVAGEYGSQVDWWVTLNEPTGTAVTGYIAGITPPGEVLATDALVHVITNMVRAHARMYDAIHANDTATVTCAACVHPITPPRPAMVSISHHMRVIQPYDPSNSRDVTAAQRIDRLYNRTFFDAIVHGDLDLNQNGTLDPGEPMGDTTLAHRADYLGVNYYTQMLVENNTAIPVLRALPHPDSEAHGLPKNDEGWDIYAHGMFQALTWAQTYGLPIVITENGIPDRADTNRQRFLVEHLAAVAAAIQAGADVRGYFHWSTIDNFELAAGYCPRFGLYAVDWTSPTRTRTARPSAALYRQIIQAGEVTDALLAAQPAYETPTSFCADHPVADAGR